MNIGKALAVSAIAGMLMGTMVGCGGGNTATPDPNAAGAGTSGGKASCSASGGATDPTKKSSCSASGGSTTPPSGGTTTPSKY